MRASPVACSDTIPLRMQEEAYKAAEVAATKVVEELIMEELLRAKKKKGTNEAPTNVGTGPQQLGLVPKKPGLQVVCEDVEVVQSDLAASAYSNKPMNNLVVDDETASTRAPSDEGATEFSTISVV